MTKTETLNLIKTIIGEAKDTLSTDYNYDEALDYCEKEIAAIAKKAAKAKETAAAKKTEVNPLREALFEALSDSDFEPIATIVEKLNDPEVTIYQATYQLNYLVKEEERAEKADITVGNRKIKGYRKIGA